MSEPTYRIEVARFPKESARSRMAWRAEIYRLSDDAFVLSGWGKTATDALSDARRICAQISDAQATTMTYYADENGDPLPQSLRVAP